MSSSVLSTFSLKLASALASFALLALTTHELGAHGRGVISILVATISIVVLLNGFIGGSSLVFLLARNRSRGYAFQITIIAYIWALVSSAIIAMIGYMTDSINSTQLVNIITLGALASAISIGAVIALCAGNIFLYNATNLIQVVSCLILFYFGSQGGAGPSVKLYIISLYGAYIICFVVTAVMATCYLRSLQQLGPNPKVNTTLISLFKYGGLAQLSNLLLFITYRLSYYILGQSSGIEAVGIYSVAVIISESLWMISGSFAIVLYAVAARESNSSELTSRTIKYVKICGIVSLFAVGALICMPAVIFAAIFGAEFGEVKTMIAALSIAIVSTSVSTIINHYFAGLGLYSTNAKVAFAGFLVSVGGNLLLVPTFGLIGAGLTASAASLLVAVWLIQLFLKHNDLTIGVFALRRSDIQALATSCRRL